METFLINQSRVFIGSVWVGVPPDILGVLESVKAAADVHCPVGGTVVEVNSKLEESPELVNKDPYKSGN